MKILGIDASGLAASAAIVDGNTLLGEITTNCKRNHSETLMPMVAELFERLEMRLCEIDLIACTNGPGSFTGLRIGAATAMSLAHGAGKKVIPVPTLDALAYNLYGCAGIAVPMMDARRGQVYTATEYLAVTLEEAETLAQGAETVTDAVDPAAVGLLAAANFISNRNKVTGAELIYVRAPQAVRELC
jgi:tRNA threonylcarbamoyladenosine biosynthesis protein TsaB